MEPAEQKKYSRRYSDDAFWGKLRRSVRAAGRELVEKALVLYMVLRDRNTPAWAKTTVVAALGYFIAPIDAIPDLIPGAGFTDDFGVMVLALAAVAASITPPMRERSRRLAERWFGAPVRPADPPTGPVIEVESTVVGREPS